MAQISYTRPLFYPKYEIWAIENFLVNSPFKNLVLSVQCLVLSVKCWVFSVVELLSAVLRRERHRVLSVAAKALSSSSQAIKDAHKEDAQQKDWCFTRVPASANNNNI